MKNILLGLVALLAIAVLFVIGVLIPTVIGAAIGAIVAYFFPGTVGILTAAIAANAHVAVSGWQIGAILGFIGGFFRTRVSVSKTTSS